MLNAEQSVEITVLHRHGMSIRALVDITGCARNTMRIPAQAGHGFQRNLDSDSNGSWTAIPRQAGQLEAVA